MTQDKIKKGDYRIPTPRKLATAADDSAIFAQIDGNAVDEVIAGTLILDKKISPVTMQSITNLILPRIVGVQFTIIFFVIVNLQSAAVKEVYR